MGPAKSLPVLEDPGGQQSSGKIERLRWRVAMTLEGHVGFVGWRLVLVDQDAVLAGSARCGMSAVTLVGPNLPWRVSCPRPVASRALVGLEAEPPHPRASPFSGGSLMRCA